MQTFNVVYTTTDFQPVGTAIFDVQLSTIPKQLLPTTKSAETVNKGCNHMRSVLQSQVLLSATSSFILGFGKQQF